MNKRLSMVGISLLIIAVIYSACAAPAAAPAATPAPAESAATAPAADQAAAPAAQSGSLLDTVKSRGKIVCGVNNQVPGFGNVDANGNYAGFDVDFCKAVAAGVLGDAEAVEYRYASGNDRFTLVSTGEVDVLFRNSTWTLTRDSAEVGMEFMPVNFYDGQGMMVRKDSGIKSIEDMDGATVCVQSGTTTELNLADAFSQRGLTYEPQVFADAAATWEGYLSGRCDAFTTDKSGLAAYRATSEDPGSHTLLEITLSKEPLAPLSPQSDPQFADIVMWVVYVMIQAEEFGITSANIGDFVGSDIPEIQRFLGQGDNAAGSLYGIPNDFMVAVITQVGNYGEVFERHLGADTPFGLERGLNALWTEGGLQYSPPFR